MGHAWWSFPAFAFADGRRRSSGRFNARGGAGFLLANGANREHSCSMKIIADICQHAAEPGLSESEALKKGAEVYATAQTVVHSDP